MSGICQPWKTNGSFAATPVEHFACFGVAASEAPAMAAAWKLCVITAGTKQKTRGSDALNSPI